MKLISLNILSALLLLSSCSEEMVSAKAETAEIVSVERHNLSNASNHLIDFKGQEVQYEHAEEVETVNMAIELQKEDIKFRLKYLSNRSYLLSKGLKGEALEKGMADLEGEILFYAEFEEAQKQDLLKKYHSDNLDKSVSYMAFDIENDFKITNEKGEELNPVYAQYERNFHVAPFERVLLSFRGVDIESEMAVVYTDKLFGKGEMTFRFPSKKYIVNYTTKAL